MLSRLTTERKVFLFFLLAWIFFYFGYWLSIGKLDLIDGFRYNSPEVSLDFVFSTIVSHLFATCAILVFIWLYSFGFYFGFQLLILLPITLVLGWLARLCSKILNSDLNYESKVWDAAEYFKIDLRRYSDSTYWKIIFSFFLGSFFVAGISWENSLFWYEGLGDLLPI